ncbi:hypothetical protein [Fluviispira vulneris]|uniref:hypothetical protein n=1 Tax=Fluviispira vulneris TaxID=2763012 RepID=UPI0016441F83|nr:hypothetical protein [Fluviispira vulneris]
MHYETLLNQIYENPCCTIRGLALDDLKHFYKYFKSEYIFELHYKLCDDKCEKHELTCIYKYIKKEIEKRINYHINELH